MRKYLDILNELAEAPLHSEPVNAETLLSEIIAAWDEPHRGDLETARDTMFDPIEKARAYLKRNAGTLSEHYDDGIVGYVVVETGSGQKLWGNFNRIQGAEAFAHAANETAEPGVRYAPMRIYDYKANKPGGMV